jgi:hypothetical protein
MVAFKSAYPTAIPFQSPEEAASQRLKQQGDELAAQSKKLSRRDDELSVRAERLRRWTWWLVGAYALFALVVAGVITMAVKFPAVVYTVVPPPDRPQEQASLNIDVPKPAPIVPEPAPTPAPTAKPAPSEAPPTVAAKPAAAPAPSAGFLEALGGLSATHLYQSHLNIGLLADAVESETYTVEDAEKNLKAVVDLMKLVDGQLAKVTKAGLDAEDKESVRQIQAVNAMLRLQVDALRDYWATGEMDHAERYHKARKASWQGLSKIMGFDA